jgi:hypothetical protein
LTNLILATLAIILAAGSQRHPGFTPGDKKDLLAVVTTPLENGCQGRIRSQQTLHPGQRSGRSGCGAGIVAPKAELTPIVGPHLFWNESQPCDPARLRRLNSLAAPRHSQGRYRPGLACGLARLGPALQLPTHPFTNGGGTESAVVAPATPQRGAVLGLGFDGEAGADQARPQEAVMKLFSQSPAHEDGGLHLLRRGVELGSDHPVRRGKPALHGAFAQAAGQTMGQHSLGPKPAEHRRGRESSEVTQRLQA